MMKLEARQILKKKKKKKNILFNLNKKLNSKKNIQLMGGDKNGLKGSWKIAMRRCRRMKNEGKKRNELIMS